MHWPDDFAFRARLQEGERLLLDLQILLSGQATDFVSQLADFCVGFLIHDG